MGVLEKGIGAIVKQLVVRLYFGSTGVSPVIHSFKKLQYLRDLQIIETIASVAATGRSPVFRWNSYGIVKFVFLREISME